MVMTAHYKIVSIDLATLCRFHQFVWFLTAALVIEIALPTSDCFLCLDAATVIVVFHIIEGNLFAILLLLPLLLLMLSEYGIYRLLLRYHSCSHAC